MRETQVYPPKTKLVMKTVQGGVIISISRTESGFLSRVEGRGYYVEGRGYHVEGIKT